MHHEDRFWVSWGGAASKLSCVKVTEAKAFDRQNAAVPFGLYDSRMGPSEKRDGLCPTCGFDYVTCPGHLGHVELVVPVYNPLVSGLIPKLLNMQCFDCHRFKLAKLKVKTYRVRLMLVEAGLLKGECAAGRRRPRSYGGPKEGR